MEAWRDAGASGYGLGTAVYRAGDSAEKVEATARAFVERARELDLGGGS